MKTILTLVFCLCTTLSFSQTILVKAGQDYTKTIPLKDRYLYKDFQNGQLHYPQGKKSPVLKLNYNVIFAAVQFIDYNGDTLFIAEESNIFKYVNIDKNLFFHDFQQGYFEIMTKEPQIKLVSQLKWNIIRKDVMIDNGYGSSLSVSNSDYSTIRVSGANNFIQNENTHFEKEISYYLLDKKHKVYKATKSNFIKVFHNHKGDIQVFLKNNNVNFSNEEDLKKLLDYCNALPNV
jgi:hypothetical protein